MKKSIAMIRPLLILFVFVISSALAVKGYAQCDLKFEYEVSKDNNGAGQISVTLVEGDPIAEYALYDLNTGVLIEKKRVDISVGKKYLLFTGLKASQYTINVYPRGCKNPYSIGGLQGIEIK